MLNLKLRDEFVGQQIRGAVISLRQKDNSGAAQQGPEHILSITYPTADVQAALRAVSVERPKRPIALIGDRGRGKSHIMAVMHHAIESPEKVEAWAKGWSHRPGLESLADLKLQRGFVAISEPVHNHEYPLLWELLFERHPQGQLFKGKFQQMGQPYPPRPLLEEMFTAQPAALILDELQTWFDGLHDDPGPTGRKWRTVASNLIQNLSEISKERPDILILAISVLNNKTDAFEQVHRDGPILIDFHGKNAQQDRQRLVLHRLFRNRDQVPLDPIRSLTSAYSSERFRLRFSHLSDAEHDRKVAEVVDAWPFSPEILDLLEGHILMSPAAQESRDLIRILASVFRARGEDVPLITPADFSVDADSGGVQSLLDSISTSADERQLRQVAQRNLESTKDIAAALPHARELISAIWMRSMSPGKDIGGTRQELQLDITRQAALDDNTFRNELSLLVDNSFNIHGEEQEGGRLRFGHDVNARTKVRVFARNAKLWQLGAPGQPGAPTSYPGKDLEHIRKTLRHMLVPENKQPASRVIVLGTNWDQRPWGEAEDVDKPEKWDLPALIVLPSPVEVAPNNGIRGLGQWLVQHVPAKRNTARFLILASDEKGIFQDEDLLFAARCAYLTSQAWVGDPKCKALKEEFDKPLRDRLKARFDRFAILRRWDFQSPEQCLFEIERIEKRGSETAFEVERKILSDLFDPAAFQKLALDYARNLRLVGDLLKELSEPPPATVPEIIPFLGETAVYERILQIAAQGILVLNVSGNWIGRLPEHSSDQEAYQHIRTKAFRSGPEMRQVQLGLPSAVGGTTVPSPKPQPPALPPPAVPPVVPPVPVFPPPPTYPPAEPPVTPPSTVGEPPSAPTQPAPAALPVVHRTDKPASGLNLSGCFETWGVPLTVTLSSARIEFSDLSVPQLKQILMKLPSAFKASLEVSYPEETKEP